MSTSVTLSSLNSLNELTEHEPAWWTDALARIADGTGYWEIAQERFIKPALFRGWIGGDPDREAAFQKALEYRKELRNERASARLAGFVDAVVKPEEINPSHVLKAIESTIGKNPSVGVSIGGTSGTVNVVFVDAIDGRPA